MVLAGMIIPEYYKEITVLHHGDREECTWNQYKRSLRTSPSINIPRN